MIHTQMILPLKRLIDYRFMISSMVKREIRGRYKGSLLGFLWNFITPFVQIMVYIIVFSTVLKPGIDNYGAYLVIGMVPWIFFSESLSCGSQTMVENSEMIKKIYFPRSILPISVVLSKLVNYLISMVIVFAILFATNHELNLLSLALLPLIMLLFFFFTLGLVFALSTLNAYLRDISYIVSVLMMVLVWASPIMYTRSMVDGGIWILDFVLTINPITYFMDAFHDVLYYGVIPDAMTMVACFVLSMVSLAIGALVIHRLEWDLAEGL